MKKFISAIIIIFIVIVAILIMFIGKDTPNDKPMIKNTKNITKISVSFQPNKYHMSYTTENKKEITNIVNYINGLDLKKTSKDVRLYPGLWYVITIFFKHKIFLFEYQTSKEYVHYSNLFFRENGKDWYDMPYEQAEKMDTIYKNLTEN